MWRGGGAGGGRRFIGRLSTEALHPPRAAHHMLRM